MDEEIAHHDLTLEEFEEILNMHMRLNRLEEQFTEQFAAITGTLNTINENINERYNIIEQRAERTERIMTERMTHEMNNLNEQNQAALNSLRNEIEQTIVRNQQSLEAELNRTQNQMNTANAAAAAATAAMNNAQASSSTATGNTASGITAPVVKLRKPTPFSGKSSECTTFFNQLRLSFAADPATYENNDKNKILLAINSTTGNAFRYVEPYLEHMDENDENKPDVLKSFSSFTTMIQDAFGDSNPILNAETALRALRQTGPVSLYVTEFRRISLKLKWNDEALMSQFKLNLKEYIKRELHRRDLQPENLNKLMAECINIDNLISTLDDRPRHHNSGHNTRNRNTHYQRQNYSAQNRGNYTSNVENARTNNTSGPTPMDTSASIVSGFNNGMVSKDDKEFRMKNGLCLNCGRKGHFSRQCTQGKLPTKINTINVIQEVKEKTDAGISTMLVNDEGKPIKRPEFRNIISVIKQQTSIASMNSTNTNTYTPAYSPANSIIPGLQTSSDLVVPSIDKNGLMVIRVTLVVGVTEDMQWITQDTEALVDSGASCSYVSSWHAYKWDLPKTGMAPQEYSLANGQKGFALWTSVINMSIQGLQHEEYLTVQHLDWALYPVILGMDWLRAHQPFWFFNRPASLAFGCILGQCARATRLSADRVGYSDEDFDEYMYCEDDDESMTTLSSVKTEDFDDYNW